MQNKLLQIILPRVSEFHNRKLSQKIQIAETSDAMQNIENGKLPGVDGLPIEFYKELFEIIKYELQLTFNKTLFNSKLTWNQVIIALISK